MLSLALSVGASGVLFADGEASAADPQIIDPTAEAVPVVPQVALPSGLPDAVAPAIQAQRSVYHTVQEGDSLWKIAQSHRVPVQDIKVANGIPTENLLRVGQVIRVPAQELQSDRSEESQTLVALAPVQTPEPAVLPAAEPAPAIAAPESAAEPDESTQPAIVADASQADSLRSAGIVSQADGFQQELQRAASAPEVVSREATIPLVTTLAPTQPQREYQVRAGDTLASIADTLGISREDLAQINGLGDPDYILAGETLVIPDQVGGAAPAEVPVVAAITPAAAPSGSQRLARLQSTAERQVNADAILSRLRRESLAETTGVAAKISAANTDSAPISAPEPETAAESVNDPYAANLVEQVRSARQQILTQPNAEPELVATASALASTPSSTGVVATQPGANEVSVVNPEFRTRDEADIAAAPRQQNSLRQDDTLLAAAPLGPEVYSPVSQPGTGQIVSPEMPIMPGAGEYLPDAPDYFNGYVWPARGTLTSGYGPRWGRMHHGVDIAGPVGTPIMAAAPGVVERAGWNSGGYGNLVDIRHPDGSLTRYAHNSRLLVRAGQSVSQGEQIAEMGSTGYSTGPHLHFEVHLPNRGTVNPISYLPGR